MGAPKGQVQNPYGGNLKWIDWDAFEKLCELHCTQCEIAGVLRITKETLRSRVLEHYQLPWKDVYEIFSSNGKMSLRRYQFNLAKKNAQMGIWLGKNILGQKDNKTEVVVDEETADKFAQVMEIISQAQTSLNTTTNNSSSLK